MWHDLLSNAAPDELNWAGETYTVQRVAGSEFNIKEDELSPGIQVTDVVLWLYSQARKGRHLPANCAAIVEYALAHGWENDFSFAGVERHFLSKFGDVLKTPLTPEQEASARSLMAEMEIRRQKSIEQYKRDRITPFMRERPAAIEDTSDSQRS